MSSNHSLINKLRTSVLHNYSPQSIINNPLPMATNKIFYVCSYGGCGSKVLCDYLSHFGVVKHVHSRSPPSILTHVGLNAKWHEWFSTVPIQTQDLHKYYVIYIYRDPIKAIQSRFQQPAHLAHIQINPATTLQQVIDSKKDLYGIEDFFDNYTSASSTTSASTQRNYKIYCVKYEELFNNMNEFNKTFNIQCSKDLYPVEKTTPKTMNPVLTKVLEDIYANVLIKMRAMRFITVR
jgi:hypothetical protein